MEIKHKGLTDIEVKYSLKKEGTNKLEEFATETLWEKFIANFKDPIIRILLVAWIILCTTAFLGYTETYEAVGLAIAIILATFVGAYTEYQSGNVFAKLKDSASKINCKVYRNGNIVEIGIDDIVVGDEVVLQFGDRIPADGILIEGSLKVDQATLNGETKEAEKIVLPENETTDSKPDTHNEYQVFRETVVISGEAVLKVLKVGAETEYGKIYESLAVEDEDSPLAEKLTVLAGQISKLGYTSGVLVVVALMIKNYIQKGQMSYFDNMANVGIDLLQAIITGIIIIVVAVPEGLPLMIAMVLSLNSRKMYRDNILVRKNVGIETAGSLNILYSDKTGTITKGVLEATGLIDGNLKTHAGISEMPRELVDVVKLSILKNTAAMISETDKGISIVGGNPTEKAVLAFLENDGYKLEKDYAILSTIRFSSEHKFSATTIDYDGKEASFLKGAPEKILVNCDKYIDIDGTEKEFTKHKELDDMSNELAKKSFRLLVLAKTEEKVIEGEIPKRLTLIGILTIRDDVRPEAITAISEVQSAGVQVVMITGDRKETAMAIATEAGVYKEGEDIALTSTELNEMSDDEVKNCLPKIKVIARALPTDKSRLVRLSQELRLVAGMTGDGVNDSPALNLADVGFAMGSGTEVAKEAGDIIIVDDNFNSIEKSILYGRTIYRSIQKFVVFQLSINISALMISIIGPLIGLEQPLTVIQMLWVNLVMDTLAAIAFGSEPVRREYMKEKPKDRRETIINRDMLISILTSGIALTVIGLWFLTSSRVQNMFGTKIELQTAYFTFFILYSIVNGFNARTNKINIFEGLTENTMFLTVMLIIVVVQVLMTFVGGDVLRVTPLSGSEWIFVIGLSLTSLVVGTARKILTRSK